MFSYLKLAEQNELTGWEWVRRHTQNNKLKGLTWYECDPGAEGEGGKEEI